MKEELTPLSYFGPWSMRTKTEKNEKANRFRLSLDLYHPLLMSQYTRVAMTPKSFTYFCPRTVEKTVSLLSTKEDAKILAGGHSLMPLMKLRLLAPQNIVDITKIASLSYIKELDDRTLSIGALTTHDTLANSPLIQSKCGLLSEAASQIGDQQVRNRGTIGGSLSHADPAADLPTAILALGGEIVTVGSAGRRTVQAKNFFVDIFTTALENDELLTEIRVPSLSSQTGWSYQKLIRRAGDFPVVSVAALVLLDTKNICIEASIALAGVGPTPLKAIKAEQTLVGRFLDTELIKEASEDAVEGINPPSDLRGSSEYRVEMVKVFVRRALMAALKRVRGG